MASPTGARSILDAGRASQIQQRAIVEPATTSDAFDANAIQVTGASWSTSSRNGPHSPSPHKSDTAHSLTVASQAPVHRTLPFKRPQATAASCASSKTPQ